MHKDESGTSMVLDLGYKFKARALFMNHTAK